MKQAPTLYHYGNKSMNEGEQFYLIPQALADIVFNELGNASAQLRIMIVLLGTKPGFNISQKWILDRTGICEKSYLEARKALVKRGWLTHTKEESIIVNISKIYADGNKTNADEPALNTGKETQAIIAGMIEPAMNTGKEKNEKTPATIAGNQHNTITGNTPAINTDIINKEQNNKEQNNIMRTSQQQQHTDPVQKEPIPIPITRTEAQFLEQSGNKLDWINETDFYINGRLARVRDIIIKTA